MGFFSALTCCRLRRGSFTCVVDLQTAIQGDDEPAIYVREDPQSVSGVLTADSRPVQNIRSRLISII